jgi:CRP-like cAMP-binding protein
MITVGGSAAEATDAKTADRATARRATKPSERALLPRELRTREAMDESPDLALRFLDLFARSLKTAPCS